MAADDDFFLLDIHDVALGNAGEKDHNTIALTGVDVVVPLEMDVDGDPLQDDEVHLRATHGYYEQVLSSSDEDVEADEDARLLYYRFRFVPPGAYTVSVQVRGRLVTVLRGLVVTRAGAFVSGKKLAAEFPGAKAAEASSDDHEDTPDDAPGESCGH
jgi:hypothetical protein